MGSWNVWRRAVAGLGSGVEVAPEPLQRWVPVGGWVPGTRASLVGGWGQGGTGVGGHGTVGLRQCWECWRQGTGQGRAHFAPRRSEMRFSFGNKGSHASWFRTSHWAWPVSMVWAGRELMVGRKGQGGAKGLQKESTGSRAPSCGDTATEQQRG